MRLSRLVILLSVAVTVLALGRPRAQVQAGLYGIGDLPGGLFGSRVQDATSVNGTIYAVGSGSVNATNGSQPDMPLVWTFDGTTATLNALPNNIVAGATGISVAFAITPDARFVASQTRATPANNAVRVENNGGVWTNVIVGGFSARAVSHDGAVVYGVNQAGSFGQAARWHGALPNTLIPLLPGTNSSVPASTGTNADGSVMVGTAYVVNPPPSICCQSPSATTGTAFRYVDGAATPVTAIQKPAGGTWSQAAKVTSDGRLTLVQGDSTMYPLGEFYVHDAVTNTITELGSPNLAFPTCLNTNLGSPCSALSDDGVAVVTMNLPILFGYIHNSHGWFSLPAVLAAAGIDAAAQGWDARNFTPVNVRTHVDGKDLIVGRGRRLANSPNPEGIVAVFPAGFLEAFDPQPAAPTDTSIVGAWSYQSPTDVTNNGIVTFQKDGTFFQVSASTAAPGFERGLYTWNPVTGSIFLTLLQDTNGGRGFSDLDGSRDLTLTLAGNSATFTVPATNPNFGAMTLPKPMELTRITGGAGGITGGWVLGNPAASNDSSMLALFADGTYYFARDGVQTAAAPDGIEKGTYTYDTDTHTFATTPSTDNNGTGGPTGVVNNLQLTFDELGLIANGPGGTSTFTRIVNPATVTPSITSAHVADGTIQTPFSFTVTASSGAFMFAATDLPAGLTINSGTGEISGTPTVAGSFSVGLTAANSQAVGSATLDIEIGNTSTGSNVEVTPAVPPGTGPISITFDNVSVPGDTTVTVVPAGPPPPTGFSIGSPATFFDVDTTATFSGPATICFSYAGMSFGTGAPRLFHFQDGAWVNVTASVDPATMTICGLASSFSPFAIFGSTIVRTGFFEPVNPLAGYVNTVAAGSTVPLKFNVSVDGIPKTDTAGLGFSVFQIPCSGGAEDPVDFVTTGNTSLRYDGTQFVQNWKTPKAPGSCYVVRMTTTLDGGWLSATFKLK